MSDNHFQSETFKQYLDPYPKGLSDSMQQLLAKRYEELFRIFYARKDFLYESVKKNLATLKKSDCKKLYRFWRAYLLQGIRGWHFTGIVQINIFFTS